MFRFYFLFVFILLPVISYSQITEKKSKNDEQIVAIDSIITKDTLSGSSLEKVPILKDTLAKIIWVTPKKTALFSAIVPGLGQIYNKQYWKLPIVYGGLGIAGYLIYDNLNNYNTFRRIYAGRISGDAKSFLEYPDYSDDVVKNARDYYRKNLDLTVFLSIIGYGLQVIDALVFAQLKNFDISPDISLKTKPLMTPQGGIGVGLVLNF